MGVVMSVHRADTRDERLRDVISVLDQEPVLSPEAFDFAAENYFAVM